MGYIGKIYKLISDLKSFTNVYSVNIVGIYTGL